MIRDDKIEIFDISQEVFHCRIYPGDEGPSRNMAQRMDRGDACNLTVLHMCAHNGTHVDAPRHFYDSGKGVDEMDLSRMVGTAAVITASGFLSAADAAGIMEKGSKRLLIRGDAVVTLEAAREMNRRGILLLGTQSQTVGPFDSPEEVHRELLKQEVALLEGLELERIPDGDYFLCAAPLNLGGADGAPCRAVLMRMKPDQSLE